MNTHARFIDALAMFGAGTAVMLVDALKFGTVILGFIGAVLAVIGGWEARKAKKLEVRLREMELERLQKGMAHARGKIEPAVD